MFIIINGEKITIEKVTTVNEWSFEPGTLQPGTYSVHVKICVDDPALNEDEYCAEASMFIRVKPSPLTCGNPCGGALLQSKANDLDMSDHDCKDPGAKGDISGLNYLWQCKKLTDDEQQRPHSDIVMDPDCEE